MDIVIPDFSALALCAEHGFLSNLFNIFDSGQGTRIIIHESHSKSAASDLEPNVEKVYAWIKRENDTNCRNHVVTETSRVRKPPAQTEDDSVNYRRTVSKTVAIDPVEEWFRSRIAENREPMVVLYIDQKFASMIQNEVGRLQPGESAVWTFDRLKDEMLARTKGNVSYWKSLANICSLVTQSLSVAVHTRSWG